MDLVFDLDRHLSELLAVNSGRREGDPLLWLRPLFILMEWLVHGIPWVLGAALTIYVALRNKWPQRTKELLLILCVGIAVDLVMVGLLKLLVGRPRPPYNRPGDMIGSAPIADHYSFPSGHSSRAAMLATLALLLLRCSPIQRLLLFLFPLCLGVSRVAMGRHYISDVIGGWILGVAEAKFVLFLLTPQFMTFLLDLGNKFVII